MPEYKMTQEDVDKMMRAILGMRYKKPTNLTPEMIKNMQQDDWWDKKEESAKKPILYGSPPIREYLRSKGIKLKK